MQYFSIPNLSAQTVDILDAPWDIVESSDVPRHMNKAEFSLWSTSYSTKHHYLSSLEGMSAQVRIGADNPVFRMHGVIADYDGIITYDAVEHLLDKPPSEHSPQWHVRTHSNKARLVWHFERPVLLADARHLKNFLRILTKTIKLDRWMAGFDTKAFGNANQYYELGKKWTPVAKDGFIQSAHLLLWLGQAAEGLHFGTRMTGGGEIPMEDIANQVREQFPGRWDGEFRVGARGVRFWDPSADNPTGALVRPEGIQCFTGNSAFVGWRQIFGNNFVDRYETGLMSELIENTAYDGRAYWVKMPHGWQEMSKEDFAQTLRLKGVDPSRGKGNTFSELDKIEGAIKSARWVTADAPFLYDREDIVTYKGARYLNTARVKCLDPAPPLNHLMKFTDGRKHFPFLYELLSTMFNAPEDDDFEQLESFLAWLQYFYTNSLRHDPKRGQCIVIAGPAGKGKTLLVKKVLSVLMAGNDENGEQDAARLLVEGSAFNDRLMYSPIWRVDDEIPKGDRSTITEFTARIKRYVSDPDTVSEQKFKRARTTPHYGRIVVLCNLDSESMRIMPSTDQSTLDKMCLFRASDHKMQFPDNREVERLCRQELPNFARFLVDWETPEKYIAEAKRFGIKSYHHPELLAEAQAQSVGSEIELLVDFLKEYKTQYPDKPCWTGTAMTLYSDLTAMNPGAMRFVKPQSFHTKLGLLQTNGFNLTKTREHGVPTWHLGFDLLKERPL